MKLYTIGFTQKSAREFFNKIKNNNIDLLIDIRLNNISQLAGFAKGKDLEYFLKEICNCEYAHDDVFAPTKELLDNYRANKVSWKEYENVFVPSELCEIVVEPLAKVLVVPLILPNELLPLYLVPFTVTLQSLLALELILYPDDKITCIFHEIFVVLLATD